jgi:LysR family hydrogen peroxide-inducible transcriptional activator
MEIHHLRYFCAVARAGSFTKAAERENLSQPSLSEAIRKLESELNAPLFERLGRSIRLTAQGERFLPHAEAVLQNVREAASCLDSSEGAAPSGRLAVGSIPTVMPYLLAPWIRDFQHQYPRVDLKLTEDVTARLLEGLQSGDLDVAVVRLPVKNPGVICSELFREPLLAAMAPTHRFAEGLTLAVTDLRGERVLLPREGHCLREDAMAACRASKVLLDPAFESEQLASVFRLTAGGFGLSIVPAMAVSDASGCVLLPLSPPAERRIGYLTIRRRNVSGAQRAFIAWLRKLSVRFRSDRVTHAGMCRL